MIDKLRDEIIESEKARTDLMKWKLILVAAIGAAAFGLGSTAAPKGNPGVLLALVPFVCLYVDALCFHNEIRIMTIAQFLRTLDKDSIERRYEEYCTEHRSHFSLEGFALLVTTLILSALVFVIGRSDGLQTLLLVCANSSPGNPASNFVSLGKVLMWSGSTGGVAALFFYCFFRYRTSQLDRPVTTYAMIKRR